MVTHEQILRQREKDLGTLKALKEAGSNLDFPHEVEHHFRSLSRSSLAKLVAKGSAAGYEVGEIAEPGDDRYFSVDLKKNMVLNEKRAFEESERMLEMAEQFDADYDGWGTFVVSDSTDG